MSKVGSFTAKTAAAAAARATFPRNPLSLLSHRAVLRAENSVRTVTRRARTAAADTPSGARE